MIGFRASVERRRRQIVVLATTIVVAGTLNSPALAERATFNPTVLFGLSASNNVEYFGESTRSSDVNSLLGLTLPVEKQLARELGRFRFSYQGTFRAYRDFTTLDNVEHIVRVGLNRRLRPTSTLGLSLSARRTQQQGDPFETADTELFLGQRTQRDILGAALDFRQDFARRQWSWRLAFNGSRANFESIDGFDPESSGPRPSDERSFGGRVELRRNLNRLYSLGAYYGLDRFIKATVPDEMVQRAGAVWGRRFSEEGRVDLRVGAFRRDQYLEPGEEPTPGLRESGLDLGLGLNQGKEIGALRVDLRAGVSPSLGGGLGGTSTNYVLGATASQSRQTSRWNWRAGSTIALRQASSSAEADVRTLTMLAEVSRALGSNVGIRFGARWADQQTNSEDVDNASVVSIGMSVLWSPLGSRRIAGR